MTEEKPDRVKGPEYDKDRADDAADRKKSRVKRKRERWGQLGAYLLIVVLGLYGFYQQDKDTYERCQAANASRTVARGNTLAVYDLGISLITPPSVPGVQPKPLTPAEQAAAKQFMQRFNDFRDKQLAKIPANQQCDDSFF
jgi:hypothetical protein